MPLNAAPAPQPSTEDDVLVEGKRQDALKTFVDRLAQAGPTDQLGRWKDFVCPSVAGIAPEQAAYVEQRIMAVASALELKRLSRCVPDLIIIVTPSADVMADRIAQIFPRDDGQGKINNFRRSDRAARWLSVTSECADGCTLRNSRIAKATTPAFSGVLILLDAWQIRGYSLGEVADYAAFVGLSNPRQADRNPSESILSMFDQPHPTGVTFVLSDSDRAYLSALYDTAMAASGAAQKDAIGKAMKRRMKDLPKEN